MFCYVQWICSSRSGQINIFSLISTWILAVNIFGGKNRHKFESSEL